MRVHNCVCAHARRFLIITCIYLIYVSGQQIKAPKQHPFFGTSRVFLPNRDVPLFSPSRPSYGDKPTTIPQSHSPPLSPEAFASPLPMSEDGGRAPVQRSQTKEPPRWGEVLVDSVCLCCAQPRIHSEEVPAFKMLIWEQDTTINTTTITTEA